MIKISTRLVLLFPKFVIKIPLERKGYLQGKNEKKIFSKYKNLNVLGDLIFEFCGIVIMKRYFNVYKISYKEVLNVKKLIPELDIENCDLFNPKNWGFSDKNYLIDYGITKYISSLYKKKL